MTPLVRLETNSRAASRIEDAALIMWLLGVNVGLPLGTFLKEETGTPVLKDIDVRFASPPPGCTGSGRSILGLLYIHAHS